MADINPEGEHDEEKTVGKQPHDQQADTDPEEQLVSRDELEAASEDASKVVEKDRVEQDEASIHWEDVGREFSRRN
jgi:hypothetical protein